MAIVSISRAAKLVRKGRQTLYNHNDKGKLSFTTDRDGKPGVDTAELVKTYKGAAGVCCLSFHPFENLLVMGRVPERKTGIENVLLQERGRRRGTLKQEF